MHQETVADPGFSLATNLPFLALNVTRWNQPFPEILRKILRDGTRLGKHDWFIRARALDTYDWGLAKRVHLLELWRRKLVICPLEDLEFVVNLHLFEQPEDAV